MPVLRHLLDRQSLGQHLHRRLQHLPRRYRRHPLVIRHGFVTLSSLSCVAGTPRRTPRHSPAPRAAAARPDVPDRRPGTGPAAPIRIGQSGRLTAPGASATLPCGEPPALTYWPRACTGTGNLESDMTLRISENVRNLEPSATLAVAARARELREAGRDIIDLGAGEPDFPTPGFIADAAIAAIRAGHTRYTAAPGIVPLRQAIARDMARRHGKTVD